MVRVLGKGGKQRLVPFNQSTASAVRTYLKDRDALVGQARRTRHDAASRAPDPLFVNYRGGRLSVRSVDRLVRRYVASTSARIGISRTARCVILCADIYGVSGPARDQELLGHAQATRRYTHVGAARLLEVWKSHPRGSSGG
jgi:integrase/recombinase XerC